MSLFRNENPNLGPGVTVQEISGYAGNPAGAPLVNNYKPVTREILQQNFDGVRNAGALAGWVFTAPWKCQIIRASVITEVSATAAATLQLYTLPVASQPATPAGTGGVVVFGTAQPLSSNSCTANTLFVETLATTASNLVMNPGDLLGYVISAAITAVIGGLVQVEVIQLG